MDKDDHYLSQYTVNDDTLKKGLELKSNIRTLEESQSEIEGRRVDNQKAREEVEKKDPTIQENADHYNDLVQEGKGIELEYQENENQLEAARKEYDQFQKENASSLLEQDDNNPLTGNLDGSYSGRGEGTPGAILGNYATKEFREAASGLSQHLGDDSYPDMPDDRNKAPSLDTNKNMIDHSQDPPPAGQLDEKAQAEVDAIRDQFADSQKREPTQEDISRWEDDGGALVVESEDDKEPRDPGDQTMEQLEELDESKEDLEPEQEEEFEIVSYSNASPEAIEAAQEVEAEVNATSDKSTDKEAEGKREASQNQLSAQEVAEKVEDRIAEKEQEKGPVDVQEGQLADYPVQDGGEEIVGEVRKKEPEKGNDDIDR